MFERFTDEARRVVVLAQEEARSLDHALIGTEHLLLGLLHEEAFEVTRALEQLGVDVHGLRRAVHAVVGRGTEPSPSHLPFTRQAKESLELALRESLQLGHREIRPTHILLGLLREGDGVAVTVLTRQGVDLAEVRTIARLPPEDTGRSRLRRWFRWDDDEPPAQMTLPLERLDDGGWEAFAAARRAARAEGAGVLDARHLLIGIASTPGTAADALAAFGGDADAFARVEPPGALARVGSPDTRGAGPAALSFSRTVRIALHGAGDEAARRGAEAAGTGDLLLALLARTGGADELVAHMLAAADVPPDALRDDVTERLG